jgi:hypothetical protein
MRHVTDGELHAFLDGSLDLLPGGRGSEVRDHISSCSVCQERLQDEEVVRAQAQDLLKGPVMPGVALPSFEELRERAAAPGPPALESDPEKVEAPRYRGPLRGVPLAWAATILVALGVGWMGGQVGSTLSEGGPLAPASLRYEDADISSLQRANLSSDPEEAGNDPALPPEITIPPPSGQDGRGSEGSIQDQRVGEAPGRVDALAASPEAAEASSLRQAEAEEAVTKPSDSPAASELLGSSAKVNSATALRERMAPTTESPAQAFSAAAREAEGSASKAEAQIPDSLENSLAVPGLEVVSIEWEERVAGGKALLIRQLLSAGDTLELRYLGMLLSADAEASVPRGARGFLEEAPGGRMYANILEASLPVGWNQVVMEWGRGLLVARAPVTEQNLKALLKTLH